MTIATNENQRINNAEKVVNAIDNVVPMSNEWKEWMISQFMQSRVNTEQAIHEINTIPLNRVFSRIIIWPDETRSIWHLLHSTKCYFELQIILNTPVTEISNSINARNQNEELSTR